MIVRHAEVISEINDKYSQDELSLRNSLSSAQQKNTEKTILLSNINREKNSN